MKIFNIIFEFFRIKILFGRNVVLLAILILLLLVQSGCAQKNQTNIKDGPEVIKLSDYELWSKDRFGVFIHWGPCSMLELPNGSWRREGNNKQSGYNKRLDIPPVAITSGEYKKYLEIPSRTRRVPMEVYDNLYHNFNPTEFDADEWVKTFKDAGAGYIVFTTKHHDGFCMFDSKYTEYDIMNTPFKRDICKELADACHKHGLKLIWYYSKADWFDPSYHVDNPKPYQEYLMNQVEELCTNYGEVSGFWWDGGEIETVPLFSMIRKYHPTAISNGRIQTSGKQEVPGIKFGTPEQRLGSFQMNSPWESCVTMYPHDSWFWSGDNGCRSLDFTLKVLANCAIGDGNLALDFGPSDAGAMSPSVIKLFKEMGDWTKAYGESIYSTRGGPYKPGVWGGATRKGNTIYLHLLQKTLGGVIELPSLPAKIQSYKVLTGGKASIEQTASSLRIEMDEKDFADINTVIALQIDRDAMEIEPIETMPSKSLTFDAKVTASSDRGGINIPDAVVGHSWEAKDLFDAAYGEEGGSKGVQNKLEVPAYCKEIATKELNNRRRFWEAEENDTNPWLEIDMRIQKTFNRISIRENAGTTRAFVLEYLKKDSWETFYEGNILEIFTLQLKEPVTAQKVRIRFTEFTDVPGVHVFHLYSPMLN